jgi:hypothetical protein
MPDKTRNGPQLTTGDRSPIADTPAAEQATSLPTVPQSGDSPQAGLPAASLASCPACGHDEITALRQVLDERHEAWRAGRCVAQDALETAELRGFAAGWSQGLAAGAERVRAA